jgi:serine/threonine protein phosphatase PrpC
VLAIVADGMGGRSGGRKASDQVMLTAKQLFERYSPEHDDASSLLKQIVQESHLVIKLTAISSEQEPHSTVAAFLINPAGDCHWVHAGDSRIYYFHGGALVKRTMDHSYVQTLVDRGELTEEEANVHPQSNILMGCLGAEEDPPADLNFIDAAAARRRAHGLQRRRLALLQPERAGLGALVAVAARSQRVPDRESALARAWGRRQPVARHHQARAAGHLKGAALPQGGTGSGRGALPDCAARCSTLARCSRASSIRCS